jgi:hypothetical protein
VNHDGTIVACLERELDCLALAIDGLGGHALARGWDAEGQSILGEVHARTEVGGLRASTFGETGNGG